MIVVERCLDPEPINRILNHESVFKFVAVSGIKKADTTPLINNNNIVFIVKKNGRHVGGILFELSKQGYSLHVAFLPECRGKDALLATREAILNIPEGSVVVADVPEFNKAAIGFARMLGGKFEYVTSNGFHGVDGIRCSTKHFLITNREAIPCRG